MTREQLLAATFLELAELASGGVETLDLLHGLAARTADLLGAASVGVALADPRGDLQLVASSSHDPRMLALEILDSRAGPSSDAFRTGRPVVDVVGDRARARWPDLVSAAREVGVHGTHALPLTARHDRLGAVGLLFATPDRLPSGERRIGEALAGVAVAGLLQERSGRQRELLAEQLQAALALRVVVEQAKGILAEHLGCGVDEAFDRIDAHARRTRTSLTAVAAGIADRSLAWEDLRGQIS